MPYDQPAGPSISQEFGDCRPVIQVSINKPHLSITCLPICLPTVRSLPRNNALAVLLPASWAAAKLWVSYLSAWTAWNHVRTIAALAATVLFTIARRFR
jgi:hypothetical protein